MFAIFTMRLYIFLIHRVPVACVQVWARRQCERWVLTHYPEKHPKVAAALVAERK